MESLPFIIGGLFGGIIDPQTQIRLIEFGWRSCATIFGIIVGNYFLKIIKKRKKK